nr:hypothetical protein [Tanacetum cinerariifolium]
MVRNLDNVSGKFLMYPRKPTRKFTQVPQPSDPIEHVADQAVHKELGDSLVRNATTASSSEAEQDSGNINKTQSKTTPNESSYQGTNSGGGPRYQESMRDNTAQTRRVKKLEKKNRSRTHKLKRLYKVGLTTRVESPGDEESLGGEEVFVVEQKVVKDVNENVVEEVVNDVQVSTATITITTKELTFAQALEALKTSKPKPKKKDQIRLDKKATKILQVEFDEEEILARERTQKEQEANIALIETWDDIQAKIDADYQLAERLQAQEQEQKELFDAEKATLFIQLLKKRRKHFAAKRAEEKKQTTNTSSKEKDNMFDKAFKRVNTFEQIRSELVERKEKRAREELIQEISKKQKVDDDKETTELKQSMEIIPNKEEVAIDIISLAIKSPKIVD